MHKELEAHIRKALSKEQLTLTVKQKIIELRRKEALRHQLAALESELFEAAGAHVDRAALVRSRIQALRKRMEKD